MKKAKKKETSKKKDTTSQNEKNMQKQKRWVLIAVGSGLLLIVGAFILMYCNYHEEKHVKNVLVETEGFHRVKISWDDLENFSDYIVLVSVNSFTSSEVDEDLKDGTVDGDYNVLEVSESELEYDQVLSDTDYYISVVAYRNGEKNRKYCTASQVAAIHTDSLKLESITDLTSVEVTDTTIELAWSSYESDHKNLDGSDIEITYTLFSVNAKEEIEIESDIRDENYHISDLMPFTEYSYKVIVNAVVDGKTVTSNDSNLLKVITRPSSIDGLTAKASGVNSISLAWNAYDASANDGEDIAITYSVYGSDTKEGDYKLLKERLESTSYSESGLAQGKTRYYYVIASIEWNDEIYTSCQSEIVTATTNKMPTVTTSPSSSVGSSGGSTSNVTGGNSTSESSSGSSTSTELTAAEKNAQARVIAKQIASSITGSTDLEKVTKAAQMVSAYYRRGVHKETGNDYYTAYGVFIKGESSCAGTTRALGMVLEEMGYSWAHANENLWTHQWVIITMDGQIGYADGQVGWAGYGKHPIE